MIGIAKGASFASTLGNEMPFTLNGFGTAYRGKTAEDEKGIYITTLFIVAFYMPVFPISSFMVCPYGERTNHALLQIQSYDAIKIPRNWRQIISVYLKWYAGAVIAITAFILLINTFIYYRYPETRWESHWPFSSSSNERVRDNAIYIESNVT